MAEIKKRVTVLDKLPAGTDETMTQPFDKKTLPEGVKSRALYSDILKLCIPSLIELTLIQLASMVDLMMVGKLGTDAITAVGLTTTPKFLFSTAFMSLNVGTMAMVGRYRGQNNREKANQILRQAFLLNTVVGFICALIGLFFARPMVKFMGAQTPEILEMGTQYLQIQMFGMFTVSICSAISHSQRGSGDSKTSMYFNTIANVLNVFLNYCLIYGNLGFPRLEVAGASLATVIGQFVALIIALFCIRRKNRFIRLEFPKGTFKFEKEPMGDILKIGIPAAIEQMAMRIGMIIFNKTIAGIGSLEFATHQVCMNIQALTFMNGQAFATAVTALVSQSLGKKRPDMAVYYSKRTQNAATACAVVIGVFIFFCNRFLLGCYSDDAALIAMGSSIMTVIAFVQPIQSSQFVMAGALRGAGDTKYTAKITAATAMILRPGMAIFFINVMDCGLWGAWYAIIIDQVIRTTLVYLRYKNDKWLYSFKARGPEGVPETEYDDQLPEETEE